MLFLYRGQNIEKSIIKKRRTLSFFKKRLSKNEWLICQTYDYFPIFELYDAAVFSWSRAEE